MLSTEAGHRRSYPPPESYSYHLCIFPCLIIVSVQTKCGKDLGPPEAYISSA